MNWKRSIKEVLGIFWDVVFHGHALVDFICECWSWLGARIQNRVEQQRNSNALELSASNTETVEPHYVFIRCSNIGNPPVSLDSVLSGDASFGDTVKNGTSVGYLGDIDIHPVFITSSLYAPCVTLLEGFDYEIKNDQILFRSSIEAYKFPVVARYIEGEGIVKFYKMLFWERRPRVPFGPSAAFYGEIGRDYDKLVWDIHVNGATLLRTKRLICAVSGAVVCENDGSVESEWVELGYRHLKVGDRVYSAKEDVTCNFSHGSDVKKGDILFGKFHLYTSSDNIPSDVVPCMTVQTDVGPLLAENVSKPSVQIERSSKDTEIDNAYILPLSGSSDAVDAYIKLCADRLRDGSLAEIVVPERVNPLQFIHNVIREGRSTVAAIHASDSSKVLSMMSLLRKCTDLGGIINLYISTEEEPLALTINGLTASAALGNVACDVHLSISVPEAVAEVKP